jgi:hypothetical protein
MRQVIGGFSESLLRDPIVYHLFYRSLSSGYASPKVVQDILEGARKKNEEAGITGILILREGFFLQLLEGEKETVQRTLERIKHDRRHIEVEVLLEFEDQHRIFPKWSMGFVQAEAGGRKAIQEALAALEKAAGLAGGGRRLQVVEALRQFNRISA